MTDGRDAAVAVRRVLRIPPDDGSVDPCHKSLARFSICMDASGHANEQGQRKEEDWRGVKRAGHAASTCQQGRSHWRMHATRAIAYEHCWRRALGQQGCSGWSAAAGTAAQAAHACHARSDVRVSVYIRLVDRFAVRCARSAYLAGLARATVTTASLRRYRRRGLRVTSARAQGTGCVRESVSSLRSSVPERRARALARTSAGAGGGARTTTSCMTARCAGVSTGASCQRGRGPPLGRATRAPPTAG